MFNDNTAGPQAGQAREWSELPEWISVREAAELSRYHPNYIRRLVRQGKMKARKEGPMWWIDRDSLRAYVEEMEALGPQRFDPRRGKRNGG